MRHMFILVFITLLCLNLSYAKDPFSCNDFFKTIKGDIYKNDLTNTRNLISQGVDVNCIVGRESSADVAAFAFSIYKQGSVIFKILLDAGLSPEKIDHALVKYWEYPDTAIELILNGAKADRYLNENSFLNYFPFFISNRYSNPYWGFKKYAQVIDAIPAAPMTNFDVRSQYYDLKLTPIMSLLSAAETWRENYESQELQDNLWHIISKLLKKGATLNHTAGKDYIPGGPFIYMAEDIELNLALRFGFNDIAKKLVLAGANANYLVANPQNPWTQTNYAPLSIANDLGQKEMMDFLLDQGADPTKLHYYNLLSNQIRKGNVKLLKRLLDLGLDLNDLLYGEASNSHDPVFWNVIYSDKYYELLTTMNSYGIDLDIRGDFFNRNFIQYYISQSNYGAFRSKDKKHRERIYKVIEYLLKNGVDVNSSDEWGQMALSLLMNEAESISHHDDLHFQEVAPEILRMIDLLFTYKANPNLVDARQKMSPCNWRFYFDEEDTKLQFLKDRVRSFEKCQN